MITVAVGGDYPYRKYVEYARDKALSFGYKVVVYDLGGLGFGKSLVIPGDLERKKGWPSALFKMQMVEEVLREHENVVCLDADAWIDRPIDSVFDDEYNIGVTIRGTDNRGVLNNLDPDFIHYYRAGYFNTGAMFFKQSPETFRCIQEWSKRAYEEGTDQAGMNKMIMPYMQDWDPLVTPEPPTYVDIPTGKIRVFSMLEYNFTVGGKGRPLEEINPPPKIIHAKGSNKKAHPKGPK